MIKAVIWDMDGVILDTEGHATELKIEVLKKAGVEVTEEVVKEYIGINFFDQLKLLEKRFKVKFKEGVTEELNRRIEEYFLKNAPLVINAYAVLNTLRKNNYYLGLATSSSRRMAETALNRHALLKLFQAVTCRDDVQEGKPNPEIFLKTASVLGINPQDIVVIEDAVYGFKSAKAAGMKVVARRYNYNNHIDFSLADYVIGDLREIPAIVKEIS